MRWSDAYDKEAELNRSQCERFHHLLQIFFRKSVEIGSCAIRVEITESPLQSGNHTPDVSSFKRDRS